MVTTSAEIRSVFVTALKGATDAGQSVYSPFDWPTQSDSYPIITVRAPKERKESMGRNAPLFTVTSTIEIVAKTKSPALVGDAGSAVALAALEVIKAQIESALINNPAAHSGSGWRIAFGVVVDDRQVKRRLGCRIEGTQERVSWKDSQALFWEASTRDSRPLRTRSCWRTDFQDASGHVFPSVERGLFAGGCSEVCSPSIAAHCRNSHS